MVVVENPLGRRRDRCAFLDGAGNCPIRLEEDGSIFTKAASELTTAVLLVGDWLRFGKRPGMLLEAFRTE